MRSTSLSREQIVTALSVAVPPGRDELTAEDVVALGTLTDDLLAATGTVGPEELQRFRNGLNRGLYIERAALLNLHQGKSIMVTGGTGCIGSCLLAELAALQPARLVSLSRGVTRTWSSVPGVEYMVADVRDPQTLAPVFEAVKPDVVYHLAAQHDPGLAEYEVARTLSTNVAGTANVIAACAAEGSMMVHASTGKALRLFSRDIYASSKKLSEWLLAGAVQSGQIVAAAARFTHVGDNSIIAQRLAEWTETTMPVRLHGPDVSFYLQSAREAAHLLMCVGLEAAGGQLKLGAIRDLGWPISLIDLALGWLAESEDHPPLYICGFEAGYEVAAYPGLYDPKLSGERSPLFNAMEAAEVADSEWCKDVDVYSVPVHGDPRADKLIDELCRAAAAHTDAAQLREMVGRAGWAVLTGYVAAFPTAVLHRQTELLTRPQTTRFSADDQGVSDVVNLELRERCGADVLRRERFRESEVTAVEPSERSDSATSTVERSATSRRGRPDDEVTVDLTVLIPTRNERDNIQPLISRISASCADERIEILFVDDSTDDTPAVIRQAGVDSSVPVRLVHRSGAERVGGLAGAVTTGLAQASGRYVVVMDGDLQHPPELVPVLREIAGEPGVQLVAAVRYRGRGPAVGLDGTWRRVVSNWSTLLARSLFPYRVGSKCSDPMTGFFCLDKEAVDHRSLRPRGFKILLEILVRNDLVVREMPFVFEERNAGQSKATLSQGIAFVRQLLRLRYDAA